MATKVSYLTAIFIALPFVAPGPIFAEPTAGPNVNMVAGTTWPDGDPFLQRQNHPSLAASSRNPSHLLGGASDWRSSDSERPSSAAISGVWPAVYVSANSGSTWRSTLLPGYPQDLSAAGAASPLKAFTAAHSPTVRAGTHGFFYYAGVAVNPQTDRGAVFVARFIDLNNKENGSTIHYLGTVLADVRSRRSFDRPAVAVDIPRAGAQTCSATPADLPAQVFPGGTVYLSYTDFDGPDSSSVFITTSSDCGVTWSRPVRLTHGNHINQGTAIAVDPVTGAINVAWRRFQSAKDVDAIFFAKSEDGAKRFTKAVQVAEIHPFDQQSTPTSFATHTFPAIAVSVDANGVSRTHIAWADRVGPQGDARIVIATSPDGEAWSAPASVDDVPIGGSYARGHQFMPSMTSSGGRLSLAYYDQRLDHTRVVATPVAPFESPYYLEIVVPRGELVTDPDAVYAQFINDAGLTLMRHTIDVRVAQAEAAAAPMFASVRASRYVFGSRGEPELTQLQSNPPNLPLHEGGLASSIGEATDITGPQMTPEGGAWMFSTAPAADALHVAWTDNRDVRPPLDGDWTPFTPPGSIGGPSVLDPTMNVPPCHPGREGMRNQNIYTSSVSRGLLLASPQNSKPLSGSFERAFAIAVRNDDGTGKSVRMTIPTQPVGGSASFLPASSAEACPPPGALTGSCTVLDMTVPAHSTVARSVFSTSFEAAARIRVDAQQISQPGGVVLAGGFSGSIQFNADPSVPPLLNPDDAPAGADVSASERRDVTIGAPFIAPSALSFTGILNAAVVNPQVVSAAALLNPLVLNPIVLNVLNLQPLYINNDNAIPDAGALFDGVVVDPSLTNPQLGGGPVSEATYFVRNDGNTSGSYRVRLIGENSMGAVLQLILSKSYLVPAAVDCELRQASQDTVLTHILNPAVVPPQRFADPAITDPRESNATLVLQPGELARVTVRAGLEPAAMLELVKEIAPVVIAHTANTGDGASQTAVPLFIATRSADLPQASVGLQYVAALQALGGTAPYAWEVVEGILPPGLSLDPLTGIVAGKATAAGAFPIAMRLSDALGRITMKALAFNVQ